MSTKFCKDCKWFLPIPGRIERCRARPSLLDGVTPVEGWRSNAELLRADSWIVSVIMNTCGKRGRWFEPRSEEQIAIQKKQREAAENFNEVLRRL